MGYAGGSKRDPTYRDLGNHSETIQVDYDPEEISYEALLDVFWNNHNPAGRSSLQQYASIIFYHDEEQRELALDTKQHQEAERGQTIYTEIVPYTEFWLAEDYHQKYRLRGVKSLMDEFRAMYPDFDDLVDSTAAARVNGIVGGHGTLEQLEDELDALGLSAEGQEKLRDIAEQQLR